ncbi:MAG: GIY-YIG nuclease family protein [Bacillaceae bacterium]
MKRGLCGVYKVVNKLNNKLYIGSSVDISSRYSTHIGRDARKYIDHPFYSDIRKYGKENFEIEILELCDRDELIEKEQYYYDILQPEYNKVRPAENNFMHVEVREKASRNSNTPQHIKIRKELYNSPEYKLYFQMVHKEKMKPVEMLDGEVVINTFISMQEASRYISENTTFKGKNKTSKIKAVCDGERKSAYGYGWRYSKVKRLS